MIEINATMNELKEISYDNKFQDTDIEKNISNLIEKYYDNFYSKNNKSTEIFYPSVFKKNYKIIVKFDNKLADVKILDNLKEYARDLRREGNETMAKAVDLYIDNRNRLIGEYCNNYVIFKPNSPEYIVHKNTTLSYDEWIKYDGISMKIGTEYEEQRSTYFHASGKYYKLNIQNEDLHYGKRIYVNISLRKKNNDIVKIYNVLIDTGAITTFFDSSVIDDLEIDGSKLKRGMISGVGNSETRILEQLNVSFFGREWLLYNTPFTDLKSQEGIRGIIGMDLIQSIKMTIEREDVYIWSEDNSPIDIPEW